MAKKSNKQIRLAQNFLRSSKLVRSLLRQVLSSHVILSTKLVPGAGIITAALARIARNVIAIEKDPELAQQLCRRFESFRNVHIITNDFMQYHIPTREYKIFANIPYNITAGIVRKILYTLPAPSEAYLIVQREAAEKFSGHPDETQFSILAKPWFDIQIIRELRKTDFEPV
jgi:16S rRNA A1518/A1519 N6-dimethyltransferase RsmA/KsgA/DIM1 with predicted DNA glycosylase/AP lyase activity